MNIIVDTNIVFSALLNSNNRISEILLMSQGKFKFYSCDFLRFEIENNYEKLLTTSKLTKEQLIESKYQIYKHINFISEFQIPRMYLSDAYKIVKNIDEYDTAFVALNDYMNGYLWTGDKKLAKGLRKVGYKKLLLTKDIFNLI